MLSGASGSFAEKASEGGSRKGGGGEAMNEETKRCALARPGSSQGRRRELARRKRLPDAAPDATLQTRQPRNPLRRRGSKVRVTSGLPQPVTLTTN